MDDALQSGSLRGTLVLLGPGRVTLRGNVLRARAEMLVVAVGAGRSSPWRPGDMVEVFDRFLPGKDSIRRGRITSTYKAAAEDHLMIELASGCVRDDVARGEVQ